MGYNNLSPIPKKDRLGVDNKAIILEWWQRNLKYCFLPQTKWKGIMSLVTK